MLLRLNSLDSRNGRIAGGLVGPMKVEAGGPIYEMLIAGVVETVLTAWIATNVERAPGIQEAALIENKLES